MTQILSWIIYLNYRLVSPYQPILEQQLESNMAVKQKHNTFW